jgi:formylglycine-generating enzyme required for sulfatase activity
MDAHAIWAVELDANVILTMVSSSLNLIRRLSSCRRQVVGLLLLEVLLVGLNVVRAQTEPAVDPAATRAKTQAVLNALQEARNEVLKKVPKETSMQREEIVRIINTPLPGVDDRKLLVELLGDSQPYDDPMRQNEEFLRHYLQNRTAPDEAEKRAFLAALKQNMLFVPGGSFVMGDFGTLTAEKLPINSDRNNPPHEVALDSYSIMRGRVTYGEYDFYARLTGKPILDIDGVGLFEHFSGYTVRPILWPEADGYCRWLAEFTGEPFALPTEAQWEYAARERGQFVAYPAHHMPEVRWASQYIPYFNSLDEGLRVMVSRVHPTDYITPRPPGMYGANRIGMQDVIGSTSEWVGDWYDADYFKTSPARNPTGPATGIRRVVRPSAYGGWRSLVTRRSEEPQKSGEYMEFRCALNRQTVWN